MQTIVFSDDSLLGDSLKSKFNPIETLFITEPALLAPLLGSLRESHFTKFNAELKNASHLSFPVLRSLIKVLKENASVEINLSSLTPEEYENLNAALTAAGFINSVNSGSTQYSNNLRFIKPSTQPALVLNNNLAKIEIKEEKQENKASSENKALGTFGYDQLKTVEPEISAPKKNVFASAKVSAGVKIDEEALLKNDGEYKKIEKVEDSGNCSTKPKACKNCTCGRKELE